MAGVSRMTVSQALNPRAGSVRVSPETRAKIQRLAQKLNYRPNLAARQLAAGTAVPSSTKKGSTAAMGQRVSR